MIAYCILLNLFTFISIRLFFLRPLWTRHTGSASVPDCTMIGSGWCRRLYKIDIGRLGPLISVAPATGDSYQQYQPGAAASVPLYTLSTLDIHSSHRRRLRHHRKMKKTITRWPHFKIFAIIEKINSWW